MALVVLESATIVMIFRLFDVTSDVILCRLSGERSPEPRRNAVGSPSALLLLIDFSSQNVQFLTFFREIDQKLTRKCRFNAIYIYYNAHGKACFCLVLQGSPLNVW